MNAFDCYVASSGRGRGIGTSTSTSTSDWDLLDTFSETRSASASALHNKEYADLMQSNALLCEWCKSDKIQMVDGNYVCIDCCGIMNRYIDTGAEWRAFAANEGKGDMNRCGMPINELLPNSSTGSIIGYGGKNSRDMRVLRKYHMWNNITYKERTLYNVFDSLTLNTVNNGINKSILEEAKNLYKKMTDARLTRGDNRNGLIASSIYIACKTQGAPRSAKEIAQMFNISSTVMTRGCKHFQEILNMSTQSTTAEDFIARICSKIDLGKDAQDICMDVIAKADTLGLVSENTPPSIAAAIIYLCGEKHKWKIDREELSSACGVSAVTILKCWKKLDVYKEHLFD